MYTILWLVCAAGAIILLIHLPLKLEIHHLPKLFSDEPEGFVELRPDLAAERNADESFQLRTLRTAVTYSRQFNAGVLTERFEISYRGKPGPVLELDDDRPMQFGMPGSNNTKKYFLSREIRDIRAFAHHVRTCVEGCRAST